MNLEPLHQRAHLEAARAFGILLSRADAVDQLPHFIGGPDEQVARELAERSSSSDEIEPDILRLKQKLFRSMFDNLRTIKPRPGVLSFLKTARRLQASIAIGTLTARSAAREILKRSGLTQFFDETHVVALEDVERPKPSPDVYLATAKVMGVPPDHQVVFEDSANGVSAATAAGSTAIAMPTGLTASFERRLHEAGAADIFLDWNDSRLLALLESGFLRPGWRNGLSPESQDNTD